MAGSEWFGAQERHDHTVGQQRAAADEGTTPTDISEATATGTTVADTMNTDGDHEAAGAAEDVVMQPRRRKKKRKRGTSRLSKNRRTGKTKHKRRH